MVKEWLVQEPWQDLQHYKITIYILGGEKTVQIPLTGTEALELKIL